MLRCSSSTVKSLSVYRSSNTDNWWASTNVSSIPLLFFNKLATPNAGEEKVAQGVVMLLALAIHDYTDGMPPMMSNVMYMSAPQYIDALVTDPEVAEAAKAFLSEVLTAK